MKNVQQHLFISCWGLLTVVTTDSHYVPENQKIQVVSETGNRKTFMSFSQLFALESLKSRWKLANKKDLCSFGLPVVSRNQNITEKIDEILSSEKALPFSIIIY